MSWPWKVLDEAPSGPSVLLHLGLGVPQPSKDIIFRRRPGGDGRETGKSLWAEMPGCSSEGSGAPWTLHRIQVCPFQLVNILAIFTTLILQVRICCGSKILNYFTTTLTEQTSGAKSLDWSPEPLPAWSPPSPSRSNVRHQMYGPQSPPNSSLPQFALHIFWGENIQIWLLKYHSYGLYSFLGTFLSHSPFSRSQATSQTLVGQPAQLHPLPWAPHSQPPPTRSFLLRGS